VEPILQFKDIGMIFQDPMTSLNPTIKVGKQITEVLIKHQKMSAAEANKQGIEMLELVGIKMRRLALTNIPMNS
jgi:oligopeptide transport system ATP-binding protein